MSLCIVGVVAVDSFDANDTIRGAMIWIECIQQAYLLLPLVIGRTKLAHDDAYMCIVHIQKWIYILYGRKSDRIRPRKRITPSEWQNDNKFMRICSSQAEANANAKNAYEKSQNNNKDSLEKLHSMKYKSHVKSKHVILLTWSCTIIPLQQCIHLLNLKPNP